MMIDQNNYLIAKFHKVYDSEIKRYNHELNEALENARDKQFAFDVYKNQFFNYYNGNQKLYPQGINILNETERLLLLDKNKTFDDLLVNRREAIKVGEFFFPLMAVIKASRDFVDYLHAFRLETSTDEEYNYVETSEDIEKYSIQWDSSFKQRDFIKLFYALNEAGFIKGEITKIVPSAAKALNFKLGGGWQPNISKGINRANNDFTHTELFENLKDSYSKYCERIIEKNSE